MHHQQYRRSVLQRIMPTLLFAACVLCMPDMVLAQASPFMTGASSLQTNILILRCSGSENGGTSQFASRLIGEREVVRRQISRGNDRETALAARGGRRSRSVTEQHVTELAVMASELEQLPDLTGYFKGVSRAAWLKVSFGR